MTPKTIPTLIIAGVLLAGCASLPQGSSPAPPLATQAPETPVSPTSTPEPKSGPEQTPTGGQLTLEPGAGRSPLEPLPDEDQMIQGSVILESTEVMVLETSPPQVQLRLQGNLPTPCHQLRAQLNEPVENNRIQIELYSLMDPNKICAQVLTPFDTTIDVGSYPPGYYEVIVNGEVAGSFTL